jgi:hypothetical protein
MKKTSARLLGFVSLAAALLVAGCAGGPQAAGPQVKAVDVLGDFESDAQLAGWSGGEGVKVERVAERAVRGRFALRVTVPENGAAGVECHPRDGDWSRFTSLRMDVVNPSQDRLVMALRVDDEKSTDYASRYNWDDGSLVLVPGRNEVEVPMRALASGRPGSRGLDLSHVRGFFLFPLGDHAERTFYLDNVRLEALDLSKFPATVMIDGFEPGGQLRTWQLSEGVEVAPSGEHVTEGRRSLRVRLPGGSWPGISIFALPRNWLPYDWLALDVYNESDDVLALGLWVRDGADKVTVAMSLRPGANQFRIPVDLFSSLRLRQVAGFCLFVSQPASGTVIYVDNIRLEQQPASPTTAEELASFSGAGNLTLDCGSLAAVARNTGFLANLYLDGGRKLLRLRPTDRTVVRQSLAFPPGRVEVSSFFLDHGTWFLDSRTVELTAAGATIRYEPRDFAR